MPGSSRSLRWWEQDYTQYGCNGANKGAEGEVNFREGGPKRDVVSSLKYCVGAVP